MDDASSARSGSDVGGAGLDGRIDDALSLLDSPLVDDALFRARLGGGAADPRAVRRYLSLPVRARPNVAWYFDRTWYVQRHPDIAESGADPLLHYLGWGASEGRSPHPLIDPQFIRISDPDLLPERPRLGALLRVLDGDLADPSPWFSRLHYRAQLEDVRAAAGGLLRHFLCRGLAMGLQPAPGLDPVALWRESGERTHDLRAGLRALALRRGPPPERRPVRPDEAAAAVLAQARAHALLPNHGRFPLRFAGGPAAPALSVVMVTRDRFALTMASLASLPGGFAGPVELVLADAGSTDETRFIARYVRGATVLRRPKAEGFASACNAALAEARAKAVLLMGDAVEALPGVISAALARMASDASIGAVCGKLMAPHGVLREAGAIVWRDGRIGPYLRGAPADAPEANFVRAVDCGSPAFLFVRAGAVRAAGGFDPAFDDGLHAVADLCLRLQDAGMAVMFDPAVLARSMEAAPRADAAPPDAAPDRFLRKHAGRLRFRYPDDARAPLFARAVGPAKRRALVVAERVPLRRLGAATTRTGEIVRALAAGGWHVTVFPMAAFGQEPAAIQAEMPDTVEVMHDRGAAELEAFCAARLGYFDTVWLCGTPVLEQAMPVLRRGGSARLGAVRLVLDVPDLVSLRAAERCEGAFDTQAALRAELESAWLCHEVVAASTADAAPIRATGLPDVRVIGHSYAPAPGGRGFAERAGLLFAGGADDAGLDWLVAEVLPLVAAELKHEARLTVAGVAGEGARLARLRENPRVRLLGAVADWAAVYDRHRVFVALGGGAAQALEAASRGLPAAEGGTDDAAGFAQAIVRLYRDGELWGAMREAGLSRIRTECDPASFAALVRAAAAGT